MNISYPMNHEAKSLASHSSRHGEDNKQTIGDVKH